MGKITQQSLLFFFNFDSFHSDYSPDNYLQIAKTANLYRF
jgi:hypothetical protein